MTVGSGCLCSVPSPAWRLLSVAPKAGPGAQQLLVGTRPTPSLDPSGSWRLWPGQAAVNLIFLVWEAAGPPRTRRLGAEARRCWGKFVTQMLPAEPCRACGSHGGQGWAPSPHQGWPPSPHSPPLLPGGGAAGPYLVLPLHKLSPGVQALDGVHSVLCGHLPPVPALQHAVPLLPPAAGHQGGQGPVSMVAGRGHVVTLRVPSYSVVGRAAFGWGEQGRRATGFRNTLSHSVRSGPCDCPAGASRHCLPEGARAGHAAPGAALWPPPRLCPSCTGPPGPTQTPGGSS